jgi:hypothetical protein
MNFRFKALSFITKHKKVQVLIDGLEALRVVFGQLEAGRLLSGQREGAWLIMPLFRKHPGCKKAGGIKKGRKLTKR